MKLLYHTADPFNYELLKENAIRMRHNPTDAEALMWDLLKNKQWKIKFRRQHIIRNYIVDFVDLRSQTIIEIDGGYHNQEEQIELDAQRTKFLNDLGFTVLRFKNNEILRDPYEAISSILDHIKRKKIY